MRAVSELSSNVLVLGSMVRAIREIPSPLTSNTPTKPAETTGTMSTSKFPVSTPCSMIERGILSLIGTVEAASSTPSSGNQEEPISCTSEDGAEERAEQKGKSGEGVVHQRRTFAIAFSISDGITVLHFVHKC